MTVQELQRVVDALGIEPPGPGKDELLTAVKKAQGKCGCFGIAPGRCDETHCPLREGCLEHSHLVHFLC
jgi:hypothetical protein